MKKYTVEQLINILDQVRLSTLFFIQRNGKIDCSLAEEYLQWIGEYSNYCKPEMAESWNEVLRKLIYNPLIPKAQHENDPLVKEMIKNNNYEIIDHLYNFMDAAEIMKIYNDTNSWEEVNKVVKDQGHSGFTFSGLYNIMIQYSLIGVDFVERYAFNRIKRDQSFRKIYTKQKRMQKTE